MTDTIETNAVAVREAQEAQDLIAEGKQAGVDLLNPQMHRRMEVNEALLPAYQKASTLMLTDEERKAITAPFPDEAVERRPHDGLLYIPHIHISDRLCQVIGPGQWCTVRRRDWIEGNRMYGEWVMLIRGCFVGESVGAMDYHPNNPKMNFSDALEGTRGECIRRVAAKELGCGSQVWSPSYCRAWEARNPRGQRGAPVGPTPRAKTPPAASETPKQAAVADPDQIAGDRKVLLEAFYKLCPKTLIPDVSKFLEDFKWTDGSDRHWLLPSETIADDLPVDKLRALVNHWETFRDLIDAWIRDEDQIPGAEVKAEGTEVQHMDSTTMGVVEFVSVKQGTKKNGERWTNYGVKIAVAGGQTEWFNSFSDTLGKLAQDLQGTEVAFTFERTPKGNTLTNIRAAV